MVGWILTIVGLGVLILTAVTLNSNRRKGTTQTTTHSDGSVSERRTEHDV